VDESLSPSQLELAAYAGTILRSFPTAREAIAVLLGRTLSIKKVERLTVAIGTERVAERDDEIARWTRLPLVERERAPDRVKPPAVVAVMADGGRYQLRSENAETRTHWHEYKAGCLLELASEPSEVDPDPEVPATFLDRRRVETLTREIGKKAADVPDDPEDADEPVDATPPEPGTVREPPKVVGRNVVATGRDSRAFGPLLASRAWSLGFFGAGRRAYVGDGQNWIWSIWERYFKPFGFVAILDVVHALTYVYAAATAGRSRREGWPVYERWIGWVWRGEVARVLVELAERSAELGEPTDEDGPTSPRRIVATALGYLSNQRSRMDYPRYRRAGLPITSSHVESTVKQLNRRVKGSEKFWSERGREALLQLSADVHSITNPLARFWRTRPETRTGQRHYKQAP
jgi:hypothetical protein